MTLRHDAQICRQQARSEMIRHALGIETPEEKAKRLEREESQRRDEARESAKGLPLFDLNG